MERQTLIPPTLSKEKAEAVTLTENEIISLIRSGKINYEDLTIPEREKYGKYFQR